MEGKGIVKKTILLSIVICFVLSCASIPHYEEVYDDSETRIYEHHMLDEIWNVALKTLAEINYMIREVDRAGGVIIAEKWKGHPGIMHLTGANLMTILIQMDGENVVLTCQSRVLNISAHPKREINEFFDLLSGNMW